MKIRDLKIKLNKLQKRCTSNENYGGVVHLPYENFFERAKECKRGLIVPKTPSIEEWETMANEHKRKLNVET